MSTDNGLLIEKMVTTNPVYVQQKLTYKITIKNTILLYNFTHIKVNDVLPADVLFLESDNPNWQKNGNVVTYKINTPLHPGETITLTLIVIPEKAETITNLIQAEGKYVIYCREYTRFSNIFTLDTTVETPSHTRGIKLKDLQ